MRAHPHELRNRILQKVRKGVCRDRIVAVAVDKKGTVIDIAANQPRMYHPGGGLHAERIVIGRNPVWVIQKIILARVSPLTETFRDIEPCSACQSLMEKHDIKWEMFQDE